MKEELGKEKINWLDGRENELKAKKEVEELISETITIENVFHALK